mgnify:CR=1 FL=1
MELWIRSQDRKDLVKVNSLWIMDNQIWMEVPYHKLAEYKTGERALQVLDEIQNAIYINKLFNADINAFQKCLENEGYTEKEISNALKTISTYQIPEE